MAINILLVDTSVIVRRGFRALLENQPDFCVVGEASDGREALTFAQQLKPHVILMDINMPVLNGIEATRLIRSELPDVCVIGLSDRTDKTNITAMLRAGASGYLFKYECQAETLFHAIREVAAGRAFVTADMMRMVMKDPVTQDLSLLENSEREVLQLLAEGASIKDIAERKGVCLKTVARARERIMDKLLIFTIAGLTKFAVRHGLTPLE